MINDIIGRKTLIPILKKILDLGAVRHRVIAQNIANVSTNGYKKKSVEFSESLRSMLESNGSDIDIGLEGIGNETDDGVQDFRIVESNKAPESGAPNNVVLSDEMADLARNQLYYKFAVNLMKRQLMSIKSSIIGRNI